MGETHWERKQRELNEDHAARRAESWRFGDLLKSQARIDETNARIAARRAADQPRDPRVGSMGVDWIMKKTALIERISADPGLSNELKVAWSQVLVETTFTHRDETDLTALGAAMADRGLADLSRAVDDLAAVRVAARPFWS